MLKVRNLKISNFSIFILKLMGIFMLLLALENTIKAIYLGASFSIEILKLIFGQVYNILFLILFLVVIILLEKIGKWAVLVLFFIILVYFTFNQLFYAIYFTNFRLGFNPEGQNISIDLLKDSLVSVIDISFYINLIAISLIIIFSFYKYTKIENTYITKPIKRSAFIAFSLLIYFIFGFIFLKPKKMSENAIFSLVESIFSKHTDNFDSLLSNANFNELLTLKYGENNLTDNAITNYTNQYLTEKKKYNVVYIVLESVGALNILDNKNDLDIALTPNLYALKNNSVLFPFIYDYFPATTRSHVPLICGGNSITYGSVNSELKYPYKGSTIISEFKKMNYQTGLFTAQFMDFESLDTFYSLQPFDEKYMPEKLSRDYTNQFKINSWGIDEKEPFEKMKNWIMNKKDNSPWFAEFMNAGTHHPYSVPSAYNGPFIGNSDIIKYKNAIHYSDFIIGKLIDFLKQNSLLENTLICVSGDHGESFGDRHYQNLLHNNYLYEENIRNFFMVINPNIKSNFIVSNKKGSVGDIMPTILSILNNENSKCMGQNLFSENYQQRIHYFYKHSFPGTWGLIDGKWKYTEEITKGRNPSLFNLETDPFEQINLAENYPEMIADYNKMIPNWYIQLNKIYRNNLSNYTSTSANELDIKDLRAEGPINITFGNINEKDEFNPLQKINPNEKLYAYLKLNPYANEERLECQWISPSGKIISTEFYLNKLWSSAWRTFEREGILEEGKWTCILKKDGKEILKGNFIIDKNATLITPYQYISGPTKMMYGIKDKIGFVGLETLHPNENIIAFSSINPYPIDKILLYQWVSPSGKKFSYNVECKAGWNYTWLALNEGSPMEEGNWKLYVFDKHIKILESKFTIHHDAKVFQPLF